MPTHPNDNDQGDKRHINQKSLFRVHSHAPASVTGLEPLLGLGSPKREWKSLPLSSRPVPLVTLL